MGSIARHLPLQCLLSALQEMGGSVCILAYDPALALQGWFLGASQRALFNPLSQETLV